jgi:hypothetical protein
LCGHQIKEASMKKKHPILPAFLGLVLIAFACEPLSNLSDVPNVQFKSFRFFEVDTLNVTILTGELIFSFKDGNADFGIDASLDPKDSLNLFLVPYKKVSGTYDTLDVNTYGRQYAVYNNSKLTRTGQDKTIKGEIKLDIYYFLIPPFDTLRYGFYITDRAGNMSNVAYTSDIVFPSQTGLGINK